MLKGLIGKKIGMTQIFTREGHRVPVTVIKAGPCTILQKKTEDKDGYNALQLGFEEKEAQRTNKPMMGHFRKADKGAFRKIAEFRTENVDNYEVGQSIDLADFQAGEKIAVTGQSKGRGFQGVMKRHGFGGGRMTHGGMNKRGPGSIGQCAYPARVFRGHKMAGHMGDERVTVRNLEVMEVDRENHLLLVRGAVPGAKNNFILIRRN
ncbi:MAG: 50S ribosomal protein L3 [Deltaproteobacteria bacterium]|nr:50S ribosomal protein L3 [Deltaproteobacteria bacterium]MBU48345.1 50S ribosomal protein L3 [Deltaproteobacteria bacterium]